MMRFADFRQRAGQLAIFWLRLLVAEQCIKIRLAMFAIEQFLFHIEYMVVLRDVDMEF